MVQKGKPQISPLRCAPVEMTILFEDRIPRFQERYEILAATELSSRPEISFIDQFGRRVKKRNSRHARFQAKAFALRIAVNRPRISSSNCGRRAAAPLMSLLRPISSIWLALCDIPGTHR
jgi:hypothetical protein